METAIQEYKPIAKVTLKNGEVAFILKSDMDKLAEAVNNGKSPLVKVGDRWVDRYDVKSIDSDIEATDAWGYVPNCPKNLRSRLIDKIQRNEESSGKKMTAEWAMGWVTAWLKE